VFVAHTATGSIEVIDGEQYLHIATISGCPEASGVICAKNDDLIFAAARGAGKILVIDPMSRILIREISAGSKPNGLAWDTRRRQLLVADVEEIQARLIDVSSRHILSTVKLPGRSQWCIYDYNRDCFLVNIRNPSCVSVLSAGVAAGKSALQTTAFIPILSTGPHGLDIDKESNRAFVACDGGTVVVLDLKRNAAHEIGLLSIGGELDVVWYNPNKGRLYCAIGKPGTIDMIDARTMTLAEEIHTEEGAHTFAFDNTRQRLYAFLPHSCRVAVYKET
jgi:DNA-binding beta-propeller fold protein YncE